MEPNLLSRVGVTQYQSHNHEEQLLIYSETDFGGFDIFDIFPQLQW